MAKRLIIKVVDIDERMTLHPRMTPGEVAARQLGESEMRVVAMASPTPAQREEYDALRALVKDVARDRLPGATSDHSDFYDANGLPA